MFRTKTITSALFLTLLGVAALASAQPGLVIQPNRPRGVHEVTVVNRMGAPVRVKIIGFSRDTNFVRDMERGGSQTHRFFHGERVVTVWNSQGQIMLTATVPFNRSGTLVLRPIFQARSSPARVRGGDHFGGGGGGGAMLSIE